MSDRIIITAAPEHAEEALRTVLRHRDDLAKCKVGWGWGFSRRGGPKFFARRTKTGFSVTQSAEDSTEASPSRGAEGEAPPNSTGAT